MRGLAREGRRERPGEDRWMRSGPMIAAGLLLAGCATAGMNQEASRGEASPAQVEAAQAQTASPGSDLLAMERAVREGAGVLSPLATLGWIPLKMLPCSLGAVGSAIGFLFTFDAAMVRDTVTLNCGGDWIITPGMLEGRETFQAVGRIEDQPGPPAPPPPAPAGVVPPMREPGLE